MLGQTSPMPRVKGLRRFIHAGQTVWWTIRKWRKQPWVICSGTCLNLIQMSTLMEVSQQKVASLNILVSSIFKETVSQDFWPLVIFYQTKSSGPIRGSLECFWFLANFHGVIQLWNLPTRDTVSLTTEVKIKIYKNLINILISDTGGLWSQFQRQCHEIRIKN